MSERWGDSASDRRSLDNWITREDLDDSDEWFICDACGKRGNADDLCFDGEPCPDEDCDGIVHLECPAGGEHRAVPNSDEAPMPFTPGWHCEECGASLTPPEREP
jgi:hypothetical protein